MTQPISTNEQTQFCDIEGWSIHEGGSHIIRHFRCPDGTMLRTEISRSKKEHTGPVRRNILKELAVDEPTFRTVIRTGKPPVRPVPQILLSREIPKYIRTALRIRGGLGDSEIDNLSLEEAEHLRIKALSRPDNEFTRNRAATLTELDDFRARN